MTQRDDKQSTVVRAVASQEDWLGALAVRHIVFVVDQGVPTELERDELDADAAHVVALVNGVVVGTARLTWETPARIGRVSVLPAYRRRGIAALLVAALEEIARASGDPEVTLHSQTYIQELYAKLGYEVTGPAFLEAGIDHVPMSKRLG